MLCSALASGQQSPPAPIESPAPVASPAPVSPPAPVASTAPVPTSAPLPQQSASAPSPTPPPIIVDPPAAGVPFGGTQTLRVNGVLGSITVTVANPALVDAVVDQEARSITLRAKALGTTTLAVRDERGVTRDVPIKVAYNAGSVADGGAVRITGDPASAPFLREQAAAAAERLARLRPGASVSASAQSIAFTATLAADDVASVNVPVIISGNDFFTVTGTTRVRVENVAEPRISPKSLLVSDFPETLTENGVLFTADLAREAPSRFLYFHYNPAGQPDRRILLRAQNGSNQPAVVQFISATAGPEANEMHVGHLATQRFLLALAQNEGSVVMIPPNATVNLIDHPMPAKSVLSGILQLRELEGAQLHLTLVAQDAADPLDAPVSQTTLLTSTVKHARGMYQVPEFYYQTTWNTTDPYLELPIGHIPLANLLRGEALSGDYGVLQSFVVRISNPNSSPQAIALYENPRGGRATGTFIIDRTLVQSRGVPPFSRYKLRQYVVPARGYIQVKIITMPEGGSSYPLRLEFAPDDGSVSPGAPGSPVY